MGAKQEDAQRTHSRNKPARKADKPNRSMQILLYCFLRILIQILLLPSKEHRVYFLNIQCLKIAIYFSYLLKFICNALKLLLWPVFKHPDVL